MKILIKMYGFWFAVGIAIFLMLALIGITINFLVHPTWDNCIVTTTVLLAESYIFLRKPNPPKEGDK